MLATSHVSCFRDIFCLALDFLWNISCGEKYYWILFDLLACSSYLSFIETLLIVLWCEAQFYLCLHGLCIWICSQMPMLYYCERLTYSCIRTFQRYSSWTPRGSWEKDSWGWGRKKIRSPITATIDWNNTEISKNKQQLKEYGKEKNLVVDKIIGLKLQINELIINHGRKSSEVAEGRD